MTTEQRDIFAVTRRKYADKAPRNFGQTVRFCNDT